MSFVHNLFLFRAMLRYSKEIHFIYSDLRYKSPLHSPELHIGDYVEKVTGDYHIKGYILSVFTTRRKKVRYVVEHEADGGGSFCHIYSFTNLSLIRKGTGLVPSF
jgi:hypothetical protein